MALAVPAPAPAEFNLRCTRRNRSELEAAQGPGPGHSVPRRRPQPHPAAPRDGSPIKPAGGTGSHTAQQRWQPSVTRRLPVRSLNVPMPLPQWRCPESQLAQEQSKTARHASALAGQSRFKSPPRDASAPPSSWPRRGALAEVLCFRRREAHRRIVWPTV